MLPSFIDRFGMSVVGAMSTYTPCIVTNFGAMPEIVGDTGYIIGVGDHRKLAERIITLLTDVDLSRSMGEQARRRFDSNFSWEAVGPKLFSLISKRF